MAMEALMEAVNTMWELLLNFFQVLLYIIGGWLFFALFWYVCWLIGDCVELRDRIRIEANKVKQQDKKSPEK